MATLFELKKKITSANISSIAQASIEETKDSIKEKQIEQLRHGLDSTGTLIGDRKPYQSADYAFYKANKNSIPGLGNPDLIDTGDFVRGLTISVAPDTFTTDSTDIKSEDLQQKYGEEILGLDKEYKAAYVKEDLNPVFQKRVREKIKL